MAANFNDKLQHLLMDAEKFTPGSQQRTESLEQIRSMLLDRRSSGSKSLAGSAGSRKSSGQGAQGFSPDDQLLEDFYLGNHGEAVGSLGLSAIPETSAADTIWENSRHLSGGGTFGIDDGEGHFHNDEDLDTFHMDDVHDSLPDLAAAESNHAMIPNPLAPDPQSKPDASVTPAAAPPPAAPTAVSAASLTSPVKPGGGAAGVLGGNLPKTPVTPVRQGGGGARGGGGKGSPSQMSSLAKEEQAAIPHVTAGDLTGVAVVPLNMEPDKRLSHKEVEQRRREKAKQYFDELRGLLPYGGDSAKFDKNAILHHSILLIKQLIQELEVEEAAGSFKPAPGKASAPDFRCCFDVSRQPLCFTGLDSRLWDANTAFCTLMGYSRMEIAGLSLLNATAASDAEVASQRWNQILKSTQASNVSYVSKLVRKDAQQIQCSLDLSLVWRGGKPQCFLVTANPSI